MPPTSLKNGDKVRVAQDADHIEGQKWQYGIVRHCYRKLLVDVRYDNGQKSDGLPVYEHEVQRAW